MSALSSWENFYVIVGSSAGALIGLQFVVITLIADRRHLATSGSLSAFGTPTVVHLAGALVLSAIMSAPWPSLVPLSLALGIAGLIGIAYGGIVLRRAHRQSDEQRGREEDLDPERQAFGPILRIFHGCCGSRNARSCRRGAECAAG